MVDLLLSDRHFAEDDPRAAGMALRRLRTLAEVVLYALMLVAIAALWNNHPPHFIYVAF
jgi:hypothetical protein